jgi:hypothetical protein
MERMELMEDLLNSTKPLPVAVISLTVKVQIPYQSSNLNQLYMFYIYHQNEKGKPCKNDLPLLKNDIPNNLEPQKPVIYSRNHRSDK